MLVEGASLCSILDTLCTSTGIAALNEIGRMPRGSRWKSTTILSFAGVMLTVVITNVWHAFYAGQCPVCTCVTTLPIDNSDTQDKKEKGGPSQQLTPNGLARHMMFRMNAPRIKAVATAVSGFNPILRGYEKSKGHCNVAMCLATSNESQYIREWIEYHMKGGVCKFYVYENNTRAKDFSLPFIVDLVDKGIVHYNYIARQDTAIQTYVYQLCIEHARAFNTEWLGFFDTDEFIVTTDGRSIPDLLENYKEFGGLALNWRLFGSSGHIKRPPGSVLKNYYMCEKEDSPDSKHIKTFGNLNGIMMAQDPHSPAYLPGHHAVNTDKQFVHGPYSLTPRYDIAWVAHYRTRSREDFEVKTARGHPDRDASKKLDKDFFERVDKESTVNCSGLVRGFIEDPAVEELTNDSVHEKSNPISEERMEDKRHDMGTSN